jgi:hypothetical protein
MAIDGQVIRRANSSTFTDVAKIDDEFDAARRRGNEGSDGKRSRFRVQTGTPGREWLKNQKGVSHT